MAAAVADTILCDGPESAAAGLRRRPRIVKAATDAAGRRGGPSPGQAGPQRTADRRYAIFGGTGSDFSWHAARAFPPAERWVHPT